MHDNTPLAMVSAIASFLQENLKDMRFPSKNGIEKTVTVHKGYLPPIKNLKRGEEQESDDYPFVIVRYLGEEDDTDKEKCILNFRILLGAFNDDAQNGWKDVVGLSTRIKFLLKRQKFIGSGELTGKIETAIYEEQMKPTWHGVMDVNFKMHSAQQEIGGMIEDDFFAKNYQK
ncbi:hypothetical protein [Ureibacillus thermosphaericus]|jgi:hypothetical protein|uniref:Uncharacterized protein n=1 Tax=Ureibacillus thermosphaericus TaxID=51173 RepID=A0A840PJR8_URETH|nr:hypothetical protein [Ureibacillus thermosphaericus]MBB5148655.1 hypothetical protein [Ureibacillus thermosphaericus]NKZ31370.1 hypothetical protein [Ureibacillus thermosphaericus]